MVASIHSPEPAAYRPRRRARIERAGRRADLGTGCSEEHAAGIAHDINNLLGVIVGYSELLASFVGLGQFS